MQKITPFLWLNDNAEAAAKFYVSIFRQARILGVTRYADAGPGPKGRVMTVRLRLLGQEFIALNGGPLFKFTEAISFVVSCRNQAEVDYYWTKLSAGGRKSRCGWLEDKFGLSWQIVPAILGDLFSGKDAGRSNRVMQAMLQMQKMDIAKLKAAYAGAKSGAKQKRKR